MRKILTALALGAALMAAPSAAAQTAGVPLQVRTGDVYTVEVAMTQTTDVGEESLEATFTQTYALHIVDAESRIWRYTPASIEYQLPTGMGIEEAAAEMNWPALSEAMSAMIRVAADIGFECRVDEFGRCVAMSNWPLWRDRMENLVIMADAFARMYPSAGAPENASVQPTATTTPTEPGASEPSWATMRGPVLRGVAAMLDNIDTSDAASMMASVYIPAYVQGRTLTRRQDVAVSDEMEMPFGAPPLRFTGTLRLDRINQRDNSATVIRRVVLDRDSARASLQAMSRFVSINLLEPMAAASREDPESMTGMIDGMLNAVGFGYEETTTGIIDLTTGMARQTTTDYTLTISPPEDAGESEPVRLQGRTVIRITPGAPTVTRLPRG